MIVECVGQAFTYRWPGGEIHLEPGKPINLPDERAKRLLLKAPGKVRVIHHTIQPGTTVAWLRADGTSQIGQVDCVHVDDTGTRWAFVTLPDASWAAVNMQCVQWSRV